MEKVLLINPPYNLEVYKENKNFSVHPPVGLAYLASFLQKYGYEVEIIDANALNIHKEELINIIVNHSSRFIGFTSVTATVNLVSQICDKIKEKTDKVLILGGQHATFKDKEVFYAVCF